MRAIWIEEGDAIDYPKLRSLGIDRIYVDIRGQFNPAARVSEIRKQGFTAGVYWGQWATLEPQASGPVSLAQSISDQIRTFEATWRANKDSLQCEFQTDVEFPHDPNWHETFIREWRKRRPMKATSWTLEGWQGGQWTWFTPALVNLINSDVNLRIVPQLYNGPMDRVYDSHAAATDLRYMTFWDPATGLVSHGGIREDRISFFYDAKAPIPERWDGFLYTNRRLP